MDSDDQAGWEWVQQDDEYYYSQLQDEDQTSAVMPAKTESNRMSFDDLLINLKKHVKKGH